MNNNGISIIIPCYNDDEYIDDCLNSILQQPIKHKFEIIIVDDNSDEKTKNILKKIKINDNIKIIFNNENKGANYCRSLGIKNSKYNYILPIDSDDKLNNDNDILKYGTYVDNAINILENNEDVAFVHCIWKMFGDFNGYTISTYPVNEKLIINKHHVQTSIVYRKEDAINCGLYDENILKWQDWSFAISLLNERYKQNKQNNIYFLDKPYYLYRIHNSKKRISKNSVSEKEMIARTVIANEEIFKKYYKNNSIENIINQLVSKKPSKLVELLYVSNYSLETALQMARERQYYLSSETEPHNFP